MPKTPPKKAAVKKTKPAPAKAQKPAAKSAPKAAAKKAPKAIVKAVAKKVIPKKAPKPVAKKAPKVIAKKAPKVVAKVAAKKPAAAPAIALKPAKPVKVEKPAKPAKAAKPVKLPVAKIETPAQQKKNAQNAADAKTVADNAAINHRRPVVSNIPVKLTPFLKVQKERLQFLRDSLLDSMAGVAKDTLRSRPEGSEGSAFGQHQADAGSDAYDKDFALSLLSQEQDALYEIEEALKRVNNGTYGTCEMSGKVIMIARLEALPFARYTVECQTELEKQRKYQKNRVPVTSLFGLTDSEEEETETEETEETPAKPQED